MKKSILALCAFTLLFTSCKKNENAAGNETKTETAAIAHPKAPTAIGTPRILFIGNSHIDFYVSLPTLFGEFCKANNTKMETEELVEMGISIEEIYNTDKEKAEKMFAKTDTDNNYYDYVVIQEKTPVAMQEAEKYKTSVKMMIDKIRKNSPGVAVYIYEVMSPEDYAANKDDFNTYQKEMKDIALQVMKDNTNTGLFRVSDAIKDAYDGKDGYQYKVDGKDRLRFGENTLHMLNDAGFMVSALLYSTIFEKKPVVPESMTFSTGTGDNDGQKMMKVSEAVSNSKALAEIAFSNR